MATVTDFIKAALRTEIRRCLRECTDGQRKLFAKAYVRPVDDLPEEELRHALALLYRTLTAGERQ